MDFSPGKKWFFVEWNFFLLDRLTERRKKGGDWLRRIAWGGTYDPQQVPISGRVQAHANIFL